jgi:hypothetical protein
MKAGLRYKLLPCAVIELAELVDKVEDSWVLRVWSHGMFLFDDF